MASVVPLGDGVGPPMRSLVILLISDEKGEVFPALLHGVTDTRKAVHAVSMQ